MRVIASIMMKFATGIALKKAKLYRFDKDWNQWKEHGL